MNSSPEERWRAEMFRYRDRHNRLNMLIHSIISDLRPLQPELAEVYMARLRGIDTAMRAGYDCTQAQQHAQVTGE